MKNAPTKPTEVCPAMQPLLNVLWLCCAPLIVMGVIAESPGIAALGACLGLGVTCVLLPFMYPRILISAEGIHIQRRHRAALETLPWAQFQCVYVFRQGMTYKACGMLFTTHPMTKQEQFEAARACQEGGFRPRLTHDGHVWVGTSLYALQVLDSAMPAHIQQMPETACANVNLRFTKLI